MKISPVPDLQELPASSAPDFVKGSPVFLSLWTETFCQASALPHPSRGLKSSCRGPLNGVKFGCRGPQNGVKFGFRGPRNEVKFGCRDPEIE